MQDIMSNFEFDTTKTTIFLNKIDCVYDETSTSNNNIHLSHNFYEEFSKNLQTKTDDWLCAF